QIDSAAWSTAQASQTDPEVSEGFTFHRTPDKPRGLPFLREWGEIDALARRIEALAGEWLPDVIHAHSPALCGLAAPTSAQTYPTRGITMIVPFAAGGPTDVISRIVTSNMAQTLGQS
ncbi:hypothetical protein ABTH62_18945, partial [Acinetobacter baumannii]